MDSQHARCTHCGTVITIEKQNAFLHCPHCGATLPSERLKRYYRETDNQTAQPAFRTEHTDFLILQGVLEHYEGKSRELSLPGDIEIIGSKAFMGNRSLISVAIPDGVTAIESEAFAYCPNLTTVILPKSLRRIEDSAFEGCPALTKIEIPEQVTQIGALAFAGCKQLDDVQYLNENPPKPGRNAFRNTPYANKSSGSSGCYIATCIYGSPDCPEVQLLRLFRDQTLAKTHFGRAFIACYYKVSPVLIRAFGRQQWFHRFWRRFLDRRIEILRVHSDAASEHLT